MKIKFSMFRQKKHEEIEDEETEEGLEIYPTELTYEEEKALRKFREKICDPDTKEEEIPPAVAAEFVFFFGVLRNILHKIGADVSIDAFSIKKLSKEKSEDVKLIKAKICDPETPIDELPLAIAMGYSRLF